MGADRPGMSTLPGDFVETFQIEGMNVRGRIVRMGSVSDRVLRAHGYPDAVSRIVGEALGLAALLGASLKFDGIMTVQTRSGGPLSMVVADFVSPGIVRACASFRKDDLEALPPQDTRFEALAGEGSFALTIDQGADMERYQGVVPLSKLGLAPSALEYFDRSEQIPTALRLAVAQMTARDANGTLVQQWRVGGILIQNLASLGGKPAPQQTADQDAWNRVSILMKSVEDHELVDPQLEPNRLLYRLFHEEGVRVFEPLPLTFGCRCSRDRVERLMATYSPEELADLADADGKIRITCEFCSTSYPFAPHELGRHPHRAPS